MTRRDVEHVLCAVSLVFVVEGAHMIKVRDLHELEAAIRYHHEHDDSCHAVDDGRAPTPAAHLMPALAQAVHASRSVVMLTDADLDEPGPHILYVNPACETLTGYRPDQLVGASPRLLQGDATDRAVLEQARVEMTAGNGFEGRTINYRRDGTPFVMAWRISPVCDESGQTTAFVAILDDVTEAWLEELRNHDRLVALSEDLVPAARPELDDLDIAVVQDVVDLSNNVGGDWTDVLLGPDGRVHLIVGDVTGHGVVAALHVGRFRWSLLALLRAGISPAAAMSTIAEVSERAPACATLGIVSIDRERHIAEVITAGHPDVLVARATGVERVRTDDPLFGVIVDEHETTPVAVDLAPGDVVCIYSDGLIERRDESLDVGIEAMSDLLGRMPARCEDLDVAARGLAATLAEDVPTDDAVLVMARFRY